MLDNFTFMLYIAAARARHPLLPFLRMLLLDILDREHSFSQQQFRSQLSLLRASGLFFGYDLPGVLTPREKVSLLLNQHMDDEHWLDCVKEVVEKHELSLSFDEELRQSNALCPILLSMTCHPVRVRDGSGCDHIFDANALLAHFANKGNTNPLNRHRLGADDILPATDYKSIVECALAKLEITVQASVSPWAVD